MITNIIDKNNLEIIGESKSVWTREQLEADIVILTQQIVDIQTEIIEKQLLLTQLNNFNG